MISIKTSALYGFLSISTMFEESDRFISELSRKPVVMITDIPGNKDSKSSTNSIPVISGRHALQSVSVLSKTR